MEQQVSEIAIWASGIQMRDLALAAAIPLVCGVFWKAIANGCVSLLARALGQFQISVDASVREGVRPAMGGFVFMLAVYASVVSLNLPGSIGAPFERLLQTLVIFFLFWLIHQAIQLLISQSGKFGISDDYVRGSWVRQVVRLTLLLLMVVVIFKVWGIDLGPALTGLGIAGAAVALAAQDLIRNLIAGFNNAGEMRFREGDWVRLRPDLEGIVEDVNLRSTLLRRFDKGLVHVPNAELANAPLVNFSRRSARRVRLTVALTYDTPADRIAAICDRIRDYIRQSADFADESAAHLFVNAIDFESSSISVLVDCFAATNDRARELATRQGLITEILRIVEAEGAEIAFPTRTIVTRDG